MNPELIADDVAELNRQMAEAWEAYAEANSVRSKALKEYNRLFDLAMLAQMRAKRADRIDGSKGSVESRQSSDHSDGTGSQ